MDRFQMALHVPGFKTFEGFCHFSESLFLLPESVQCKEVNWSSYDEISMEARSMDIENSTISIRSKNFVVDVALLRELEAIRVMNYVSDAYDDAKEKKAVYFSY